MSSGAILVAVVIGLPALILALRAPDKTKVPDDWVWARRSATRIAKWRAKRNAAERRAQLSWLREGDVTSARPGATGSVIRAFRQPVGRVSDGR